MSTARDFTNGNSLAVCLPLGDVRVSRDAVTGDNVLSMRSGAASWDNFFGMREKARVPNDFLVERPLNQGETWASLARAA
jgi:hypothetical protein